MFVFTKLHLKVIPFGWIPAPRASKDPLPVDVLSWLKNWSIAWSDSGAWGRGCIRPIWLFCANRLSVGVLAVSKGVLYPNLEYCSSARPSMINTNFFCMFCLGKESL